MICFSLICDRAHEFEAWFRNNDDFDKQARYGLVECPHCGSSEVAKALMTPAVSTAQKKEMTGLAMDEALKQAMAQWKTEAARLRESAEYVGDRFAEEARRIHFGETDPRGIYGEATIQEVSDLIEDGVDFIPLPFFGDDRN